MLWLLLAHSGCGSATLINHGQNSSKNTLNIPRMSENQNRKILEMKSKLENLIKEVIKD
jgi:hypothetical protein